MNQLSAPVAQQMPKNTSPAPPSTQIHSSMQVPSIPVPVQVSSGQVPSVPVVVPPVVVPPGQTPAPVSVGVAPQEGVPP